MNGPPINCQDFDYNNWEGPTRNSLQRRDFTDYCPQLGGYPSPNGYHNWTGSIPNYDKDNNLTIPVTEPQFTYNDHDDCFYNTEASRMIHY